MRPYTHINHVERTLINNMHFRAISKTEIARNLNKHCSSIYREIYRNKTRAYHDKEAQELSESRRSKRFRKHDTNGSLRLIVCTLLIDKNLPEVILFYLKNMFPNDRTMHISHESIYSWIYEQKEDKGKFRFTKYLFTHRKKRQKMANIFKNKAIDTTKKNIRERPKEAEDRTEAGHIEGDIIVSARNDAYVLTLVDKRNVHIWGTPLPIKDANTVTCAVSEALSNLPDGYVKTITFDNGTEFSMHKEIEDALGCKVYFADPYCSWQRGLNEHINGRRRQYLPKKKSFAFLTDNEFDYFLNAINNRPRKSRGWKSPTELIAYDLVALDP